MALYAMPVLIINMGGEMVYILEQRLRAQNIANEKSKKVLTDVLQTMYSDKFIKELFKPQEVYTNSSTRHVFDRLAHSSIMRLNSNSMDKLYDLMTMGVKYQVLSCRTPADIVKVTQNHLDALHAIVKDTKVAALVEEAQRLTEETFGSMSIGELWQLKAALCSFFQDRRVKVSLFLHDGIQNLDGTLTISTKGPVPPGSEVPGKIRHFTKAGGVSSVDNVADLEAEGATAASGAGPCALGGNMYTKDRSSKKNAAKPKAGPDAASIKRKMLARKESERKVKEESKASEAPKMDAGTAAKGLNLLAGLVGRSEGKEEGGDNFKLALFPDDRFKDGGGSREASAYVINIDAERVTMADLAAGLGLDDDTSGGGGGGGKEDEDEDDLLALMDSTSG